MFGYLLSFQDDRKITRAFGARCCKATVRPRSEKYMFLSKRLLTFTQEAMSQPTAVSCGRAQKGIVVFGMGKLL